MQVARRARQPGLQPGSQASRQPGSHDSNASHNGTTTTTTTTAAAAAATTTTKNNSNNDKPGSHSVSKPASQVAYSSARAFLPRPWLFLI